LKDYVIKENGLIIAGIRSCFYLGECLAINVLFVEKSHRLKGLGTLLLNQVEADARAIGAKMSHLYTLNHQAKDFYLKHGYEIFGVLENCPAYRKMKAFSLLMIPYLFWILFASYLNFLHMSV
jgi:GNAT superfamily N-acetyltransferase